MKSLMLLGLTGLAAAHPQHGAEASLAARGIDLNKYRLPQNVASYTSAEEAANNKLATAVMKRATYVERAADFVRKTMPGVQFRIVEDHYTSSNGISHVRAKQTLHGIDIDNGDFNVNVARDGTIFSYGNNFFSGKQPATNPLHKRAFNTPLTAFQGAIKTLGLPINAQGATVSNKGGERFTIYKTTGTMREPEARLVYLVKEDRSVALTWRVETDVNENWLLTYVDANNNDQVHAVVDYVTDLSATFKVHPWDVADPSEGERTVIGDPWTSASPFTWFGDGTSNYTTTRGNNGIAQSNPKNSNDHTNLYRPNVPSRKFEFPYAATQEPKDYVDHSITQLWFTANKYHDVLHALGFTEAAGNFQTNNNGKGGKGADSVILNTQDGSGTNNANFATPPDGQQPRMRMYVWTKSTPSRDSSLDAGVVLHEYTHGLSNRLTGGPANSNCLSATESGGMGEGWSDFFAVSTNTNSKNTRTTDVAFGHWIFNNKAGIRAYPYSTNMKTNPHVYSALNSLNSVHAIGNVWATMLYEVMWNLIEAHGNSDADFPKFDAKGVPTDGKFLVQKLVLDGMTLHPCNPNFIQARNGILDADKALTGSANKCAIWKGFAKRGLGAKAVNASTRKDDFSLPAGC